MNWVFIVVHDNCIEQIKTFNDFWVGAKFTDDFIFKIDPSLKEMPKYNRRENYKNGNLTIGLYKQTC